jgi:hypothetical protein
VAVGMRCIFRLALWDSGMTTWKVIGRFPDYEVSSCGRVRFRGGERRFGHTARQVPPSERRPQPHSGGYLQTVIKGKNLYFHRLVAEAFVPNIDPDRKQINHRNGNKHDNRAENLEWTTSSENHLHKTQVLKIGTGGTHSQAKLSEADVKAIRVTVGTQQAIADAFGVSRSHVGYLRSGRGWSGVVG